MFALLLESSMRSSPSYVQRRCTFHSVLIRLFVFLSRNSIFPQKNMCISSFLSALEGKNRFLYIHIYIYISLRSPKKVHFWDLFLLLFTFSG